MIVGRVGRARAAVRSEAANIAAAERRRLARELHDGLAQDLAFIAAYAGHLADVSGDDHPIVIAARRALTALRGTISDLSATDTPSLAQAVEMVGDELAHRHRVTVDVRCHGPEVSAEDRVELVRIMREAVINAVCRGNARHVWVTIAGDGDGLRMRIDDDGTGTDRQDATVGVFGLRSMYGRSARLGGRLSAREREGGGTAIEVVVP